MRDYHAHSQKRKNTLKAIWANQRLLNLVMILYTTGIPSTPMNCIHHAQKFDGDVDKEFNRHILCNKFHQLPLLKNLVNTFEKLYPYLSIDMVWLLIKSKPSAGFQRWHKDFILGHKITKTNVVNLFTIKRCDLLGGPDCFFNIRDNDEGNKAKEQSLEDDNNNSLSQNSSAHLRHVEAMAKKNHKQQTSAVKAMKQCGKAALEAGAGIGVVVSLKVDYCTHSHA